jgi:hypothetical protein
MNLTADERRERTLLKRIRELEEQLKFFQTVAKHLREEKERRSNDSKM